MRVANRISTHAWPRMAVYSGGDRNKVVAVMMLVVIGSADVWVSRASGTHGDSDCEEGAMLVVMVMVSSDRGDGDAGDTMV